jgi:hypothetical protein
MEARPLSLAILCCHYNPCGYHEPRRNLSRFLRQMKTFGHTVYVAELAYGDEPFFLSPSPYNFQFRTDRRNVLWHKENLLNVGEKNIPDDFDKIAWIDPDVWFMNPSWFSDAEKALDLWPLVQLFGKRGFLAV